MLAVVKALQQWRQYLERSKYPIHIITDHKNLEYWKAPRNLNRRQLRWLDLLQHYDFKIQYRPGHESGKPDALSRRHDHRDNGGEEHPQTLLKEEHFADLNATYAADADIIEAIKAAIEQDETIKPVLAYLRADHEQASAEVREAMKDYTMEDGVLYRQNKIYVPKDEDIKQQLLELYHDSEIVGHPGQAKTLELVSRGYYWPSMKAYVNQYVGACDACQRNKQRHSRLQGSLKPLPVPEGPWQSISCDFIVELPKSNGYDTILVVVDRLTKMAHFIPTTINVDAKQTARLLIDNVWKTHGTPRDVISDRGPQFASKVTRSLFQIMGIKSNLSTAYHPQTDGQTERVNGILEQYLRIFSAHRQNDWADHLPLAEFAYNNAEHASTGMSPFFANYGFHPTLTTHPTAGQQSPAAGDLVERIAQVQEELSSAMLIAQEKQKAMYDRHREATPEYKVGEEVWLEGTNIRNDRPSAKLSPRRYGPFLITEKVGSHSYRLQLPTTWRIHPVFHVQLLRLARPDPIPGRRPNPPPPEVIEGDEEYELDKIINSRYVRDRLEYLVRWKGYHEGYDTWEPAEGLERAQEAVEEFHHRFPDAFGPQFSRRVFLREHGQPLAVNPHRYAQQEHLGTHQPRGRTRSARLHSTTTANPSSSPRSHSVPTRGRIRQSDRTYGWASRRSPCGCDVVSLGQEGEEGAYVTSRSTSLNNDTDPESFGLYHDHMRDL
jgi:hypothetical protein